MACALILAVSLSSCGKKGPLDPPPPKEEKQKKEERAVAP